MAEIGLAAVQTALAAVQTVSAVLQYPPVKDICSVWGYKSQLKEFSETIATIKNVLLDAETRVLSNEERRYIKGLKDVVYEADDLFDEFFTRLELKQLQGSRIKKGGKFYKKVRLFFSSHEGKFSQAYRMFNKFKKIQTKLNSIVDNHRRFALDIDHKQICLRGEDTCSYVDKKVGIIGRDDDKKAVVKMLLESKSQDVGFLSIVGGGGLGKTALAQLVYNDEDIQHEFGDLSFWVCVADQDKQRFDVKVILSKILKEVNDGQRSFDAFELQQLQKELQKELGGKKYMLVLDDVWNEDRAKWVDLQKFLMVGERGSQILVTTRSEMTAGVVGDDDHTYRLQGLSPENSWDLFKKVAFTRENYQQNEFLEVGEKIVAKCCNTPLAIKVAGSLLYGQDIKKWKSVEETGLSKMEKGDNQIMSVLKLSYYNLKSPLKSCFTYCAAIPKDYEIEKKRLIRHWMAQGYIVPADQGGQSIADVAEEYFLILLRRCFFQDAIKDYIGHVLYVKIHDFMHDIAQEMAGKEFQISGNNIGDEVRHWSFDRKSGSQISSSKLRSYICLPIYSEMSSRLMPNQLKCVRVLELKCIDGMKSFESIGQLLHLRYLHLSHCKLEAFPGSSITRLHNLQTFSLYKVQHLRELPHDFSKLEKLVHIEIKFCSELQTMPSLSKLPYLKSLELVGLDRLQHVEKTSSFAGAEEAPFFPSLEYLSIWWNDELKGWFDAEVDQCQSIRRCPCLSYLSIRRCTETFLETLPACPAVKYLDCDKLGIVKQVVGKGNGTSCLATLYLHDLTDIESEDDFMLWKALNKSLRTLIFIRYRFKSLPEWMQCLTSLQTIKLVGCIQLNALPEWISCLTSLQDLQIELCSEVLHERCSKPSGADWPKIQYIPNIPEPIVFCKDR